MINNKNNWWKKAVGYQIYPISFFDSNGDGIGDIRGIIQKIEYIKNLGVDLIWLNPVYKSPKVDNGYDIADFQDVDPTFGTLDDLRELIDLFHENGIHLIMDLVVNHTSDQHQWFVEALKSKDNPYHDYYHWVDGTADSVPNDWKNWNGQSEWTFVPELGQWYFHIFNKKMPDLNWENPKLREEILAMIKWWLDFGIDGFRLDAISHIKKMPFDVQMSDYDGDDIPGDKWQVHTNVTGFKNYLEMMKEVFDQYPIFTVGEASGVSSSQAQLWTGDDGYFKSIFELEQNVHDSTDSNGRPIGNLKVLKNTITEWQEALRLFGWMSPYLANHDNPRSLQTWGDNKTAHSAKALATVLLSLQGTPFVYFGDEIGIPSFDFKSIEEINDPEAHMGYENQVKAGRDPKEVFDGVKVWNRDQGRSPMQWNDSPNGGFSTGKPWMPVNPSFTSVNVENEIEDPDSIFNYYKRMIELRKEQTVLNEGEFSSLAKDDKSVCSFVRKTDDEIALVIANLTDGKTTFQLPEAIYSENWVRVIENAEFDLKKEIELNPWDAAIFKRALL